MKCPTCDLDILVANGTIAPHLRPQDLSPCDGTADERREEPPKTVKAPAKTPVAKKPTEH